MLTHWISPIDQKAQNAYQSSGPSSLGSACIYDHKQLPTENLIALIGWDPAAANLIRQQLYGFSDFTDNLKIADLGNFNKTTLDFALPALHELCEANIPWILLGGSTSLLDLHMTFYELTENAYSAVTLHENPSSTYTFTQRRKLWLEEFTCMGFQGHVNSGTLRKKLPDEKFHTYGLGLIRKNIEQTEPVMRSSDLINVHLSVLRKSDAPAQQGKSTSGLFIEEACQVMRYAGFYNKPRTITLAGWDPEQPSASGTANVIAQMLWYYMEGMDRSHYQRSRFEEQMTEYLVHLDISDTELSFYKDETCGTWWVKLQGGYNQGNEDLLPCSYQDYHAACQNMLSDRIFKLVQKAG